MSESIKDPRILFFLAGSEPTAEEYAMVLSLGSNCVMRNGAAGTGGAAPEQCDGVSALPNENGDLLIPEEYLTTFVDGKRVPMPDGAEALKAHREGLMASFKNDPKSKAAKKPETAAAKTAAKSTGWKAGA